MYCGGEQCNDISNCQDVGSNMTAVLVERDTVITIPDVEDCFHGHEGGGWIMLDEIVTEYDGSIWWHEG